MSDPKFTEGPWYIEPGFARSGVVRVMAEQCTPVATVPEHSQANASLISAAPELYAALEGFVEWVQSPLAFSEGERAERAVKVMACALAALAKARGE